MPDIFDQVAEPETKDIFDQLSQEGPKDIFDSIVGEPVKTESLAPQFAQPKTFGPPQYKTVQEEIAATTPTVPPGEALKALLDVRNIPVIPEFILKEKPGQGTPEAIAKAAANAATEFVRGLSTPQNMALLYAASKGGPVAAGGVGGYFGASALTAIPDLSMRVAQAKTTQEKAKAWIDLVLNSAFGGMMLGGTSAGMRGVRTPPPSGLRPGQIESQPAMLKPPEEPVPVAEAKVAPVPEPQPAAPEQPPEPPKPPAPAEQAVERERLAQELEEGDVNVSREPRLFREMSNEDLYSRLQDFRARYRPGMKVHNVITLMRQELAHRAGKPEGTLWGNFGFLEEPKPLEGGDVNAQETQRLQEVAKQPEPGPQPAPVAPAVSIGGIPIPGDGKLELYNLTEDIPGHPKNSTVSAPTLEKAGFKPPPPKPAAPAAETGVTQNALSQQKADGLSLSEAPGNRQAVVEGVPGPEGPAGARRPEPQGPQAPVGEVGTQPLGIVPPGKVTAGSVLEKMQSDLGEVPKKSAIVEQVKSFISDSQKLGIKPGPILPPPSFNSLRRAWSAAKSLASEIHGLRRFTPFRETINSFVSKVQIASLQAREMQRMIERRVPLESRRVAITNYRQAGGDMAVLKAWELAAKNPKLAKGYHDAQYLTPEEVTVAKSISTAYEDLFKRGESAGVLDSWIDNYANQTWKRPFIGGGSASEFASKVARTFKFGKPRYFDSFSSGEAAGYVPLSKDASKILGLYITELEKTIATREMIEDLSTKTASDGRRLAAPKGISKPVSNAKGDVVLNFPNVPGMDAEGYVALNHPALADWKFTGVDTDGKPVLSLGNLALHPDIAGHVRNMLGRSEISKWYESKSGPLSALVKGSVKGIYSAGQFGKQTMLGFLSPFHQVQEATHAIGHRVNPFFNLPKLDSADPVLRDATAHGLMVAGDHSMMAKFREGLDARQLLSKIPVLGKWATEYQDFLFEEYIPRLKFKTYEHILKRNSYLFQEDLASGKYTLDDIKSLSAEQSNAAYGHLNYSDIGRNPTLQHMLSAIGLAPDFLEARLRFSGQAAKSLTGGKAGVEQLKAMATLAVTFYVAARIANKLENDDYFWEEPFGIRIGNRIYTMRSVPEDLFKMFTEPRRFIYNRLNPIIGRIAIEALTGKDVRGEKVTPIDAVKDALSSAVPITLRNAPGVRDLVSHRTRNDTITDLESFAGSLGLGIKRFSEGQDLNKLIDQWMSNSTDPKIKENYERRQNSTFPESAYRPLRQALADENYDVARTAYDKLRETKSRTDIRKAINPRNKAGELEALGGMSKEVERKFKKSLNDEQRALYQRAQRERTAIFARFEKMLRQE